MKSQKDAGGLFALVTMEKPDDVNVCISKLNQTLFCGQKITVMKVYQSRLFFLRLLSLPNKLSSMLWHCWLDVRKSAWPVTNWVTRRWCGCLSGVSKRFACGPAVATATPSFLASLKSRMVLPFWCQLIQVVLEKRPLDGCLSALCLPVYRPLCYDEMLREWHKRNSASEIINRSTDGMNWMMGLV